MKRTIVGDFRISALTTYLLTACDWDTPSGPAISVSADLFVSSDTANEASSDREFKHKTDVVDGMSQRGLSGVPLSLCVMADFGEPFSAILLAQTRASEVSLSGQHITVRGTVAAGWGMLLKTLP